MLNLYLADNMETSFSDGCYLIMLIGQLDGYFVPHYSYYIPGKISGRFPGNTGPVFINSSSWYKWEEIEKCWAGSRFNFGSWL